MMSSQGTRNYTGPSSMGTGGNNNSAGGNNNKTNSMARVKQKKNKDDMKPNTEPIQ